MKIVSHSNFIDPFVSSSDRVDSPSIDQQRDNHDKEYTKLAD